MEESLAGRSFHDAMDLDVYLHMSVDIGPQTCGHMSSDFVAQLQHKVVESVDINPHCCGYVTSTHSVWTNLHITVDESLVHSCCGHKSSTMFT